MGTQQAQEFEQMLAEVGVTVTPEGRQRARAKLEQARETFTEEKREQLRQAHLAA
jgi:hypothetical protein